MIRVPAPTLRDLGVGLASTGVFALIMLAAQPRPFDGFWLSAVAWLMIGLVCLVLSWANQPTTPPVDIWDLQRQLMSASDQRMPQNPTLHSGVLMYYAITLEEMSETAAALYAAMTEPAGRGPDKMSYSYMSMTHHLFTTHRTLHTLSLNIRKLVPALGTVDIPLSKRHAKQIFDGTTDCTVTIAGMGISAGLPCAAGYLEVQASNLSKRNPATGKIDKEPDGKWIKGRHYAAPDLGRVLDLAWGPDHQVRKTELL